MVLDETCGTKFEFRDLNIQICGRSPIKDGRVVMKTSVEKYKVIEREERELLGNAMKR